MCDMVCVLQDEVDFERFKTELVSDHERTRNGTATWKENQDNQVVLKSAVGGELSVTLYSLQRKIMAQANPEPLFQFVKCFANTMNNKVRFSHQRLSSPPASNRILCPPIYSSAKKSPLIIGMKPLKMRVILRPQISKTRTMRMHLLPTAS